MNIKHQIRKLYALSFLGAFNLTDGIWVLLMASRGFSLWEIGLAEGIFHAVSLLFEIPSGMLADSYGRKRTLFFSQIAFALSCAAMMLSNSLFVICLSMAFCAMGYNLASGTTEALRYDSLLEAGEEKRYMHVSSLDSVIWSVTGAVCKLVAGVALKLGYLICYGLGIVNAAVKAVLTLRLREANPTGKKMESEKFTLAGVCKNIKLKFIESKSFVASKPVCIFFMLISAVISACTTMTGFLMQQHFVSSGIDVTYILGVLLFIISLGSAVGARLALRISRLPFRYAAPLCGFGCAAGLCLCAVKNPFVAAFGGFSAYVFESAYCTLNDAKLNSMFPSSDRATLISVNEMSFSLIMFVLSPLYGFMGDALGTGLSFLLCGVSLAVLTVAGTTILKLWRRFLLRRG